MSVRSVPGQSVIREAGTQLQNRGASSDRVKSAEGAQDKGGSATRYFRLTILIHYDHIQQRGAQGLWKATLECHPRLTRSLPLPGSGIDWYFLV
jgi:hypothetical protein